MLYLKMWRHQGFENVSNFPVEVVRSIILDLNLPKRKSTFGGDVGPQCANQTHVTLVTNVDSPTSIE